MQPHHEETIRNVAAHFRRDPEVIALLLGGSLAHGFAGPDSDVDIMILVSDADYDARVEGHRVHYHNTSFCGYEGGYVDGKYLGVGFVEMVAARGSEPARYSLADCRILFSRDGRLDETIRSISRYPAEGKAGRIRRFYAQFEAWNWYAKEAIKRGDPYLLGLSVAKLVLFGGRMILAHNELLYPYHKWFMRVLEGAPDRPADLPERIAALHRQPDADNVRRFYETVRDFREWEQPEGGWPARFLVDSEWNWQTGSPPVDDL